MHDFRALMTSDCGVETMDQVIPVWRCAGCDAELEGSAVRVIADPCYEDLASFVRHARRALAPQHQASSRPVCEGCGQLGSLSYADYHCFHEGRGADLVLRRARPGHGDVELFWWSEELGHCAVRDFSELEERSLWLSALVRRAVTIGAVSDEPEELAAGARRALRLCPGDRMLVKLVRPMLRFGHGKLAASLCDTRLQVSPLDIDAHAAMAEVIVQCVNHGALGVESLSDADNHISFVLGDRPRDVETLLTAAIADRLRGQLARARRTYEQVLVMAPQRSDIHFNLGAMLLDEEPEEALLHFLMGESLDPEDPDYVAGRARALVRLKRRNEAAVLIPRIRELDARHPRLPGLEQDLGLQSATQEREDEERR